MYLVSRSKSRAQGAELPVAPPQRQRHPRCTTTRGKGKGSGRAANDGGAASSNRDEASDHQQMANSTHPLTSVAPRMATVSWDNERKPSGGGGGGTSPLRQLQLLRWRSRSQSRSRSRSQNIAD